MSRLTPSKGLNCQRLRALFCSARAAVLGSCLAHAAVIALSSMSWWQDFVLGKVDLFRQIGCAFGNDTELQSFVFYSRIPVIARIAPTSTRLSP